MLEDYSLNSRVKYSPKWEKDIERHPDKRRSESAYYTGERENSQYLLLEVPGFGVIVMRSETDENGETRDCGMSLVTKDDLNYGS